MAGGGPLTGNFIFSTIFSSFFFFSLLFFVLLLFLVLLALVRWLIERSCTLYYVVRAVRWGGVGCGVCLRVYCYARGSSILVGVLLLGWLNVVKLSKRE